MLVGPARKHSWWRRHEPVDPHRPRDVFERLLPHVFEGEVETACGVFPNAGRDADSSRLGQGFEPGRDVDAVAKDVAVLDDDVPDIDPDAEVDAAVRRRQSVAFG